jgi:hypothetical protein
MIKIDVSIGDIILTGKFKNKKTEVKNIGVDDYGMPTINGRTVVKFRKTGSLSKKREARREILQNMEDKVS